MLQVAMGRGMLSGEAVMRAWHAARVTAWLRLRAWQQRGVTRHNRESSAAWRHEPGRRRRSGASGGHLAGGEGEMGRWRNLARDRGPVRSFYPSSSKKKFNSVSEQNTEYGRRSLLNKISNYLGLWQFQLTSIILIRLCPRCELCEQ